MDGNYFVFNAQQTFYGMLDKEAGVGREPVDDNGVVLYKTQGGVLIPEYISREDRDVIPFFPTIEDVMSWVQEKRIGLLYTTDIGEKGYKGLQQLTEKEDREEFLDVLGENYIDIIRGVGAKVITLTR